ncbi:MAG: twin-arginine translocase subunit TatB [Nitrospinae bacterium]|nr:twin-arginine translocase subunit TatB [Nitrospinota bacterium]
MFGIGMQELLIVLVIALIILGPKKLPEMARTLGRAFAELQRATQDLRSSVDFDVEEEEDEEPDEDEEADDDLPPAPGDPNEAFEHPEPGEADEVADPSTLDEAEETSTERTS